MISELVPDVVVSPEKVAIAKAKQKICYQCPECMAKVWGKPGLKVVCGECDKSFEGFQH